jgi:hypothetical protein
MRIALLVRFVSVLAIITLSVGRAFACQCSVRYRARNAWENAKLKKENATIFEGTPTKFELRWDLLDAKESELIAGDALLSKSTERMPHMVVTFHVAKTYKGNLGTDVQVHTGLGGGDCGATYMPGLNYLVYALGPSLDRLGASMCSPGGWLEGTEAAIDLRYLRKERATATDMAPILHWSQAGWDKQEEERQRRYAEYRKKFETASGKICGTLVHADPQENGEGSIAFLSTLGYSPNSPDYAEVKEDGSFCSRNLGPGKYYLYFVRHDDHGVSALYYPGLTDVAKATPVEVSAGQKRSIVFHVLTQPSYSVRGFISAADSSAFDSDFAQTSIGLVRSDGDRRVWYAAESQFRLLPKLGYFKFENVVPGRYFVPVQTGSGWMSRKVVVDVTTHSKFIFVDLVRRK